MTNNVFPSKTTQGITFEVTNVALGGALKLYPQLDYLKRSFDPRIEACSNSDELTIDFSSEQHVFVQAVHCAFSAHYPLVIAPDHIWLLICQGFAKHVRVNIDRLRHLFVEFEGKKTLQIEHPEFQKGAADNAWEEVFPEFTQKMQGHLIGDFYDLLIPTFSTTGAAEKAAFEISMMDTFSDLFNFHVFSRCGIPSITLQGTPADWRSILERTRRLGSYDLDWWLEPLIPILEGLVRTSEGQIDREFWTSFYKKDGHSGGPYVTGWLKNFFPYYEHYDGTLKRNPSFSDENEKITIRQGGTGRSFVPFKWECREVVYDMYFVAGFMSISQNPETKAIKPEIGWAIYNQAVPGDEAESD